MKRILFISFFTFLAFTFANSIYAQFSEIKFDSEISSDSASASISAQEALVAEKSKEDITKPEAPEDKGSIINLFTARPATDLKITNFMAFFVQRSVAVGVPANTIVLILLLPFLATFYAFTRVFLGLTSLEMLVPIILSVALIATGLTIGTILLVSIIAASFLSRFMLKKIKIMQLPKMAMSLIIVSLFVFVALTISAAYGNLSVKQISIFPILLFILISDKVVELQLQRKFSETVRITFITISLSFIGFLFLSVQSIQNLILIYPELLFILIPINLLLGRYFGLRITEYLRFSSLLKNGNK